jgi:hypothetical protein
MEEGAQAARRVPRRRTPSRNTYLVFMEDSLVR